MSIYNSYKLIVVSCILVLSLCFTAQAAPSATCNSNVQITAVSVNSNVVSVTAKNNGSSNISVQVLTYKKYSASDVATTPADNSGVAYLNPSQSATIKTSVLSCSSVVKIKVGGSCETVIDTYPGSGYCPLCSTCPKPTPTPVVPVCDAGGPYTNLACSSTPVNVQLDGSKSSHPHGDTLSYVWSTDCPSASLSSSTVAKPNLSLVTSSSTPVSCKVNLTVKCSTGPAVTCSSNVTSLPCTTDCAGTINGTAVLDRCGVCSGDGQSCLGCQSVNIEGSQLIIDSNANTLRNNVLKVNKQLEVGSKNASLTSKELSSIKKYIANSNKVAEDLYKKAWGLTYTSFPPVLVSCAAAFCVNTSTVSTKAEISSTDLELVKLAQASSKRLDGIAKKAKSKRAPKAKKVASASANAKKIATQSVAVNQQSNAELGKIPGSQSNCG